MENLDKEIPKSQSGFMYGLSIDRKYGICLEDFH